jgi:hypothetical protein
VFGTDEDPAIVDSFLPFDILQSFVSSGVRSP